MSGYASYDPKPPAELTEEQLAEIASQIPPYEHPSTHPATMITEDVTHRFVTDTEKSTWNGKQNALGFTPAADNHTHDEYAADDHDHGTTYAAYTHAHTGVYAPDGAYEPSLEAPEADGYILSSDVAGNRLWISPTGGGLTQAQILTRQL